jgi:hypothetical protein
MNQLSLDKNLRRTQIQKMDVFTNNSAKDSILAGYIPFGICSFWGFRLLIRGLRGDVLDASGMVTAPRSLFIIGGILLQLPIIGYTIFVWKQGFFGSTK